MILIRNFESNQLCERSDKTCQNAAKYLSIILNMTKSEIRPSSKTTKKSKVTIIGSPFRPMVVARAQLWAFRITSNGSTSQTGPIRTYESRTVRTRFGFLNRHSGQLHCNCISRSKFTQVFRSYKVACVSWGMYRARYCPVQHFGWFESNHKSRPNCNLVQTYESKIRTNPMSSEVLLRFQNNALIRDRSDRAKPKFGFITIF